MTLYHFCSDVHLLGIQASGLTLGRICWVEKGIIHSRIDYQWLTENPERGAQSWCDPRLASLPYDRCANRLGIEIPTEHEVALSKWSEAGPLMVPPDQLAVLNMFGNPGEYYIYRGKIPAKWIKQVDRLGARWGAGTGRLVRTPA